MENEIFEAFLALLKLNVKKKTLLTFINADWRDFQNTPAIEEKYKGGILIDDYLFIRSYIYNLTIQLWTYIYELKMSNVYMSMTDMKKKQTKIIREQLDDTLKRFSSIASVNRPMRGWIRAIRDALGMNMRQFANRLGVSKSRIPRIEQDEITGSLTLKTMNRVAETLDCVFVYGLVPRTSLDETVKKQASIAAKKRMSRLMHTMNLEAQGLSSENAKKAFDNMVDEIIDSQSMLWEKDK